MDRVLSLSSDASISVYGQLANAQLIGLTVEVEQSTVNLTSQVQRFQVTQDLLQLAERRNAPRHTNSRLLEGSPQLAVDVHSIDSQHQKLVELRNQFYASLGYGPSEKKLKQTLGALVEYTVLHFKHEKRLMQRYHYPDSTAHQLQHKKLIDDVVNYRKRLESGREPAAVVASKMPRFLKDWLIGHIMQTDKTFGTYLAKQGAAKV